MAAAVITGDEDRTMQDIDTKTTCPNCRAHAGIPIVYGYPAPDQLERSEAGKIELGGCICTFEDPEWSCTACRHRWCYPCLVTSS